MTEENELRIVYGGVCDQTTIANMTNHSYFNLAGEGSGSAMDQYLTIHAEQYTPVGEESIPLGEKCSGRGNSDGFPQGPQDRGMRLRLILNSSGSQWI